MMYSSYPRNELTHDMDSHTMLQLQLVPSGVVIVREKKVCSSISLLYCYCTYTLIGHIHISKLQQWRRDSRICNESCAPHHLLFESHQEYSCGALFQYTKTGLCTRSTPSTSQTSRAVQVCFFSYILHFKRWKTISFPGLPVFPYARKIKKAWLSL